MYKNRFLTCVVTLLVVVVCGTNAAGEVSTQGVDNEFLLTITKEGTGDGNVTPSTGTLTWNGNTATAFYAANTEVTLTAEAGNGSMFNRWSGCNTTNNTLCTITMSDVKSVFVDFRYAVTTKKAKKDFNNDGKTDVIAQSTVTRDVPVLLMDGVKSTKGGYVAKDVPDAWQFKAAEDLDGDGKADVIWYNKDTGDVYIWLMDGLMTTKGAYAARGITSEWQITKEKSIGDFDGDGKNDLLWQNTSTGAVYIWLMDGFTQNSGDYVVKAMQPFWQIEGIGDFDGDGKSDVLFRNKNTGDVYLWLMDGVNVKKGDYISRGVPDDWHIKTVADHNKDGKADILWVNNTGSVYIWLMDGTSIKGGDFAKPKSGSSQFLFRQVAEHGLGADTWDMKAVGDYNGDGMNDMLWQNGTTGEAYIWFIDYTGVNFDAYKFDQGIPTDWSIY
ncbi:FG-GAP repeat domain-containing protein [Candidatus Magnetobacterium bavaricum]|uniref:FG-GAP repeat domain-containing protein n=1 Tax=Candidatus Magnetobacterium bavaricum TaxID=29290 RepID=A0A0F3GQW7_9BACT|nr:FG-GAP repeat domain-containing protein [Candidatus Magnetobacterium bavaricum]